MSFEINDVGELEKLLKKLDLKVQSLDELKSLLATVQRPKDHESARLDTIKQIGVTVPCTAAGVAGAVSFFLILFGAGMLGFVGIVASLGAIWTAVAIISVAAIVASALLLRRQRSVPGDLAPASTPLPHLDDKLSEFITARNQP